MIMCAVTVDLFFFRVFSSRRRHTRYWRDWSSDVCSSDLFSAILKGLPGTSRAGCMEVRCSRDRKSVVWGKSVDLGGRRIIKKKKQRREWNRLRGRRGRGDAPLAARLRGDA